MRIENKKFRISDIIKNSANSLKIKNNLDKIYIALSFSFSFYKNNLTNSITNNQSKNIRK